LADLATPWPPGTGPANIDRSRLAWLSRPLQRICRPLANGALELRRPPSLAAVEALLDVHDRWSERFWDVVDADLDERLLQAA
jgi:hypothetical protein